MNSQKMPGFVLGVLAALVGSTLLLADGSRPVPPPTQRANTLLADGSRPVPPPTQRTNLLLADGSRPVPPPTQLRPVLRFPVA